jgi:hypothetical protein
MAPRFLCWLTGGFALSGVGQDRFPRESFTGGEKDAAFRAEASPPDQIVTTIFPNCPLASR